MAVDPKWSTELKRTNDKVGIRIMYERDISASVTGHVREFSLSDGAPRVLAAVFSLRQTAGAECRCSVMFVEHKFVRNCFVHIKQVRSVSPSSPEVNLGLVGELLWGNLELAL